jgi:extracellular elastinolytic metalloproteinase
MNSKLIFHLGTVALFLGCASLAAQNNTPTISKTIALNKAKELAIQGKWGMVPEDMQMAQIQDLVIDRSGEGHAYVLQTINGIPVVNGVMGLHFRPDGTLYYTTNRAVPHVAEHLKGDFAQLNTSALGDVALKLAFTAPSGIPTNVIWESMKTGTQFEEGKYYEQTVAWPNASGDLIPAKYYVFFNAKTSDWVNVWISEDGSLLQRHSWTVSCAPSHFHNHKSGTGAANASAALTQSGGGKTLTRRGDGATYKAYAYPTESPLYGNPSNLSSPADAQASPYGWHDVNGAAGAEYTITRGNNVYASEDADANNQPGYSPNGGTSLVFDFTYSRNEADPVNYRDFAINNLFVANNMMHDLSQHYGFDEESGNFQQKNYSGKGIGNDAVSADAQDGSGTNNANFATPPEGSAPRMQMYIWDGVSVKANLVVNYGAGMKYGVGITDGNWGKKITATPVSGKLVLVKDNVASATNKCCTNLSNGAQVNGNIAAVVRGGCTFVQKVFRAQSYGATAVVLLDTSSTDAVITMATDNTSQASKITIPVIFVKLSNANELRKLLADTSLNVTFYDSSAFAKKTDSDLDLGVMAHEYTHGISNRLTCGPSNSNGLSNAEQMGEGWSDFVGLAFTAKKGDVGSQSRGVGNWLNGQTAADDGIRTYPYSTNMAINPHTYANLAKAANGIQTPVHYTGEIWCAMLWDMYWEFVEKYGFDEDLYNGKGGNNIAVQLVFDAMKLQPCGPGFTDARDALLMADENRNGGANAGLIWKAFARRGLGYNAAQGSPNNCADGEENFELPPASVVGKLAKEMAWFKSHPNPASSYFVIEPMSVKQIENVRVWDLQGKSQVVGMMPIEGGGKSLDVSGLLSGVYLVEITAEGKTATLKLVKP